MLLKPLTNRLSMRWFSIATRLQRALKVNVDNQNLVVTENNQEPMKFPGVWLRDNCQCLECFHKNSQSRQINWEKFDINVKIKSASILSDKNVIKVDWSDQHSSNYDLSWLQERDFGAMNRVKYLQDFYRPKSVLWSKNDFKNVCRNFQFNEIMESDNALKSWLESLAINGIAMIKNAPLDKGAARRLIEKVGFIRKTHYGEEFIVQAKPGARNYAYLSTPLQIHTDLPYYEYKPSVNILHCVVQSKSPGGSNLLTDGFYVAERLKQEFRKYFEILTETLVDWNDIGQEEEGKPFHTIFRSPVICLDKEGNYTRINYSVPQRDSHFSVKLEKVVPWYEAFGKFVEILHEESVEFKTIPGDIITFNNIRLLHGRTGYDDKEGNVRYIVGAYMDWDIIYATLRALKKNVKS